MSNLDFQSNIRHSQSTKDTGRVVGKSPKGIKRPSSLNVHLKGLSDTYPSSISSEETRLSSHLLPNTVSPFLPFEWLTTRVLDRTWNPAPVETSTGANDGSTRSIHGDSVWGTRQRPYERVTDVHDTQICSGGNLLISFGTNRCGQKGDHFTISGFLTTPWRVPVQT